MKKLLKKEYWLFVALLILGMGLVAGVFVTQQQQDIRNRAVGFRPTVTPTRRPTTIPAATASPTLAPTPFVSPQPPTLTVIPFANDKKEAPVSFTITGSSSPNAQITIEISPDGIFGTATADENGQWRYIITQTLTPGAKQLRVTATDIYGITTTYTEDFTVARGGIGARIWTILGLIAAIVVFIIILRDFARRLKKY